MAKQEEAQKYKMQSLSQQIFNAKKKENKKKKEPKNTTTTVAQDEETAEIETTADEADVDETDIDVPTEEEIKEALKIIQEKKRKEANKKAKAKKQAKKKDFSKNLNLLKNKTSVDKDFSLLKDTGPTFEEAINEQKHKKETSHGINLEDIKLDKTKPTFSNNFNPFNLELGLNEDNKEDVVYDDAHEDVQVSKEEGTEANIDTTANTNLLDENVNTNKIVENKAKTVINPFMRPKSFDEDNEFVKRAKEITAKDYNFMDDVKEDESKEKNIEKITTENTEDTTENITKDETNTETKENKAETTLDLSKSIPKEDKKKKKDNDFLSSLKSSLQDSFTYDNIDYEKDKNKDESKNVEKQVNRLSKEQEIYKKSQEELAKNYDLMHNANSKRLQSGRFLDEKEDIELLQELRESPVAMEEKEETVELTGRTKDYIKTKKRQEKIKEQLREDRILQKENNEDTKSNYDGYYETVLTVDHNEDKEKRHIVLGYIFISLIIIATTLGLVYGFLTLLGF